MHFHINLQILGKCYFLSSQKKLLSVLVLLLSIVKKYFILYTILHKMFLKCYFQAACYFDVLKVTVSWRSSSPSTCKQTLCVCQSCQLKSSPNYTSLVHLQTKKNEIGEKIRKIHLSRFDIDFQVARSIRYNLKSTMHYFSHKSIGVFLFVFFSYI